jgi:hypothetical protein
MKPQLTGQGEALPSGVTIEQIATELGALTTARLAIEARVSTFWGREIPLRGEGLTDLTRNITTLKLVFKGKEYEHLDVGGDTFRRLSPEKQRRTSKLWRWACHCPYGDENLWVQILGALSHSAKFIADATAILNDEPVHLLSFLISPRRSKKDPAMTLLAKHLRAHRHDGRNLHVWLGEDLTARKVRLQFMPIVVSRIKSERHEYFDFGIPAELAAPARDQVTGKPRPLRGRPHSRQPAGS